MGAGLSLEPRLNANNKMGGLGVTSVDVCGAPILNVCLPLTLQFHTTSNSQFLFALFATLAQHPGPSFGHKITNSAFFELECTVFFFRIPKAVKEGIDTILRLFNLESSIQITCTLSFRHPPNLHPFTLLSTFQNFKYVESSAIPLIGKIFLFQ